MISQENSVQSLCKDIDNELRYEQLPPQMIVKDYVKGEENCNYEIYLREFLNESCYFKRLSKEKLFRKPENESNGQCDAETSSYSIDFKLLISSSKMEANSVLSPSIEKYADGVYGFGASKRKGQMKTIRLLQSLRYKTVKELELIYNNDEVKYLGKSEIKTFLKKLCFKKNIIFFIPYNFLYISKRDYKEAMNGIQLALYHDLKASMEFREKYSGNYDTFLAALYDESMIFFKIDSNNIDVVDLVKLKKSPTFVKLRDIKPWTDL
ncbi:MAG: hypothetical protein K6B15_07840 [Parasporobacterium sp.]|nr:hypothetical protein [Parasporobacterium sp.]